MSEEKTKSVEEEKVVVDAAVEAEAEAPVKKQETAEDLSRAISMVLKSVVPKAAKTLPSVLLMSSLLLITLKLLSAMFAVMSFPGLAPASATSVALVSPLHTQRKL